MGRVLPVRAQAQAREQVLMFAFGFFCGVLAGIVASLLLLTLSCIPGDFDD